MTLQLELGKKYLNRRGEVVEIVYHYGSAFAHSWEDTDGFRYTDSGEYYKQEIHEEDLVSEYVEPSTKPTDNATKVPHPHAGLIIAWASGEIIEYLDEEDGEFYQTDRPSWDAEVVYRIKPEKKVDVVNFYASRDGCEIYPYVPNLELTFEDGKLIKAEVL